MKRRQVLKWSAPVVTCVVLPAHAITSDEETPTTTPQHTTLPTTTPQHTTLPPPPPNPCPDGETLICHNPNKEAITKCVEDDEILRHINHGDYFGACNE